MHFYEIYAFQILFKSAQWFLHSGWFWHLRREKIDCMGDYLGRRIKTRSYKFIKYGLATCSSIFSYVVKILHQSAHCARCCRYLFVLQYAYIYPIEIHEMIYCWIKSDFRVGSCRVEGSSRCTSKKIFKSSAPRGTAPGRQKGANKKETWWIPRQAVQVLTTTISDFDEIWHACSPLAKTAESDIFFLLRLTAQALRAPKNAKKCPNLPKGGIFRCSYLCIYGS